MPRFLDFFSLGTGSSNLPPSSSESDANLIPEVVGLGRAIKHGDRIGANTPDVCRVAAAEILTRRPARKAAFSARPGCRHPWRSPLGKTHTPDKVCWYRPCVGGSGERMAETGGSELARPALIAPASPGA